MTVTKTPFLIAGPTASGKSTLAIALARRFGGIVINADALQVYDGWRVLTARPSQEDEETVAHALYGHVPMTTSYSVGHWLRDLAPFLCETGPRPIIIGGTGLYFSALTEGLAEIPPIPADIRHKANQRGPKMRDDLAEWDPDIVKVIDMQNMARVQRAWEVYAATGRPLSYWQANTGPALLPLTRAIPFCLTPEVEWLNTRIETRFADMLVQGAVDECRAQLDAGLDMSLPSAKALGAAEIFDMLRGNISLETAAERATIATRQFAKRQRTWFRSRMKAWHQIPIGTGSTKNSLFNSAVNIIENM